MLGALQPAAALSVCPLFVPTLLVLFYVAPLNAQSVTGTLHGTVRDVTGAVIPGATVTPAQLGVTNPNINRPLHVELMIDPPLGGIVYEVVNAGRISSLQPLTPMRRL